MYAFKKSLSMGFDQAVEHVVEELKKEGFGVLTDIDVAATMKAKLNVEGRPYRILGACNPPLAHRGLGLDPDLGILMPCNVVVREEEDGSIAVVFMNVATVTGLSSAEGMKELGEDAAAKLQKVHDAL
ncbi:DUF302 domain-containing protein [Endothiovibrio diazotrophicus]